MQTFKIFEDRLPSGLEDAVNNWVNAHNLKIVDFKYSHTTEANGSSSYSAGVLFEPADPDAATAIQAEQRRATNEMLGRKIVENGGVTVLIRSKTGSGKSVISDMLGRLAHDYGISFEHECERSMADPFSAPAELVKLGTKGKRYG